MPPAKIEYRAVATSVAPIEQRAEGDKNVITGYGAVFYNSADPGTEYSIYSDMVERIGPNAFDDALNRDDVRGLFNHDSSMLLGRMGAKTLRLAVDQTGLRYEIDMPDTSTGNDVMALIRRGDIFGSSFSFQVEEQLFSELPDGKMIRTIMKAKLFDVGPVTFPAYQSASTSARSDERFSAEWDKMKTPPPVVTSRAAVRTRVRMIEIDLAQ